MEAFRILEQIAQKKGYKFLIGTRATLNLYDEALNDDDVVLMADAFTEGQITPNTFGGVMSKRLTIDILLLKRGRPDEVIYNETGYLTTATKWAKIEQLEAALIEVVKELAKRCASVTNVTYNVVVNAFDVNLDGITAKITLEQ